MKKILLILSLTIAFNVGFAQQNKQNNYSAFGAHPFSTTAANFKTAPLPPVPTTTTSSCMSVNLPTPATWTLTNYGTGTPIFNDGFVNGPNIYGDLEKAQYFDVSASSNTLITQVYVGFDIAFTATPSKTVAVKIYQGTTGAVGAALGTATITMGEIMSDVAANRYSLLIFPTPIAIASKKFFASVDVSGLQTLTMPKDSLSIVSNTSPQTNPTQVWEKWDDASWHKYTTAGSWNLNISLLIHPFLTQSPIVSTFSTSSNTICAGQSVSYNSAGSTAGTYQWSFGAIATPTAAGATSAATYSAAGTYTTLLIVSDACGSLGAAQTFITVNAKPTVSATPSSTVVCSGTNITLNGGGASTYAWTGGAINGTAFAPANGNYTVTGTAANGCTNTAVTSVTVNALPTVSVTSGSICNGGTYTITPSGASTYTISGGSYIVSPTGNATYSLTGTSSQGCLSSNTAVSSVTVNNLPTVTANATSTVVCAGTNVTLNGGGATTYTWTNSVSNAVAFAPASSNTYIVNGTDANGCQNSAMVTVNVNNLPIVTANATSTAVCAGGNVTLTGGGATTYTWSNSVADGVAFTPSTPNTYTVNGTDLNGCQNSAMVMINLNNLPTVTAGATSTSVCNGVNTTLNGGGATTYTWSGTVINGAAFAPSTTDTYTVTGTDMNGCMNTAMVTVVVNSLPTVMANATSTLVCTSDNVILTGGGATTYTWTNGVTDGVGFTAPATNTYVVTGTDINGCVGSATVEIVVSTCTGIKALASVNMITTVFPNPSNGEFTITSVSEDLLSITNELGQTIQTIQLNQDNNFSYKVNGLSIGMYFVSGKSVKQKVIVTR
ncbi:MAG: T9SS type A sorting domain-containing protein [Bacteroidota bacterium]